MFIILLTRAEIICCETVLRLFAIKPRVYVPVLLKFIPFHAAEIIALNLLICAYKFVHFLYCLHVAKPVKPC